jgi:hypothetical protein
MLQSLKMICLISLMTLVSLNSFGLTAKEARENSFRGMIETNDTRIEDATNNGECESSLYIPNHIYEYQFNLIVKHYRKLGYHVDEKESRISWCD